MEFILADVSYTINSSILTAYVIDPARPRCTAIGFLQSGLFWSLEIEVKDEWIMFWHQDIQVPDLQRWTDLAGHVITWDSPINVRTGEMNGGWAGGNLVSGHHEILEAKLHFSERDRCDFRVQWRGICAASPLGCGPDEDEQLPFEIDCWCAFAGVSVPDTQISAEPAKLELISNYLDTSDFLKDFVYIPKYVPGTMRHLQPCC